MDRLKFLLDLVRPSLLYHQEEQSCGPKEGEVILLRVLYEDQMKLSNISFSISRFIGWIWF